MVERQTLLLHVSGNWHNPYPNEPLILDGWGGVFKLIIGNAGWRGALKRLVRKYPPPGKHCAVCFCYCRLNIDDFITDEVDASGLNLSEAVKIAMRKPLLMPEEGVVLDSLPSQVAAASLLSLREVVLSKFSDGGFKTDLKQIRLGPLGILDAVNSRSYKIDIYS